ncbi:TraR/DksA family transcriptional regulator [Rhodovulum sulfidophilum]|uniref:TraR/DksA family transcriptional regulator n=2 Tax=Rhodovulum sulfidophilum TaxID=35806 RepID=UPI003B217262
MSSAMAVRALFSWNRSSPQSRLSGRGAMRGPSRFDMCQCRFFAMMSHASGRAFCGLSMANHGKAVRPQAPVSGAAGQAGAGGSTISGLNRDLRQSRGRVELAVEREEDEVLQGLDRRGRAGFRPVRAALARIESGGYGFCVRCGEGVAEGRPDAGFATPFCRICAR